MAPAEIEEALTAFSLSLAEAHQLIRSPSHVYSYSADDQAAVVQCGSALFMERTRYFLSGFAASWIFDRIAGRFRQGQSFIPRSRVGRLAGHAVLGSVAAWWYREEAREKAAEHCMRVMLALPTPLGEELRERMRERLPSHHELLRRIPAEGLQRRILDSEQAPHQPAAPQQEGGQTAAAEAPWSLHRQPDGQDAQKRSSGPGSTIASLELQGLSDPFDLTALGDGQQHGAQPGSSEAARTSREERRAARREAHRREREAARRGRQVDLGFEERLRVEAERTKRAEQRAIRCAAAAAG